MCDCAGTVAVEANRSGFLEQLAAPDRRVVGAAEVRRALLRGQVREIYLAKDAQRSLTAPLEDMCAQQGIVVHEVESMKELGEACGIPVKAAVAGILK